MKNSKHSGNPFTRILFLVFAFYLNAGIAQDTVSTSSIDQQTYQLYLNKNWPLLINIGKEAIQNGTDYFYLRMRMGIAYYEQKNYSQAEPHFKKALTFNTGDALAMEYLYFCYVYMGRNEDARALSKSFNAELAEKTGTAKNKAIDFIILEGGTKICNNLEYYNIQHHQAERFYDPATYFQAGLSHFIKNKVSFFHAFTWFNQQYFRGSNRQWQYYLRANIPIRNNWLLSPSFHYINRKNSMDTITGPPMRPNKHTTITNTSNFSGSLSLQKILGKFRLGVGTTVSNMNDSLQLYHFGSVSFAVLGNSKIIVGSTVYVHTINNYSSVHSSLSPFIYLQPLKRLAITASYLYNTGNNLIEENGYLVNNSSDLTTSRWSFLANVPLSKHVSLYAVYQIENKLQAVSALKYHFDVVLGGVRIGM